MKYGTLRKFEQSHELPARAVSDIFKGKTSRRTADAIATELGASVHSLFPGQYTDKSAKVDTDGDPVTPQSLIVAVR